MTTFLCLIYVSICAKVHGVVNKYVFFVCVFYTEIQDGHQKWQENDFEVKSPVDPEDTLQVKHFVEITQNFKMAAKNGGLTILGKITS